MQKTQHGGSVSVPLDGYASSLKNLRIANPDDSYYYVRVKPTTTTGHHQTEQENNHPVASIPASCWMNAGSQARIEIHKQNANAVYGLSLLAPCSTGQYSSIPEIDRATLVTPTIVTTPPFITIPHTDTSSASLHQQQMTTDDASDQKDTSRTPQKQEKDDRTWLQKNWMFVALGFFILANRLGNAAVDQQQQPNSRRS